MPPNRRSDDKSSLKYRLLASGGSLTKYHSRWTFCRLHHKHQSEKEATRCNELFLLARAGLVKDIKQQPEFILQEKFKYKGRSIPALKYRADFSYIDCQTGHNIIEDVKGFKTAIYKLKKKIMLYSLKDKSDTEFLEI